MYFTKVETTANFSWTLDPGLRIEDRGSDVWHLTGRGDRWPGPNPSVAGLDASGFSDQPSRGCVDTGAEGNTLVLTLGGTPLLQGRSGATWGIQGTKWVCRFPWSDEYRFYGFGEKNIGFELSRKRTLFWNTDVFADFAMSQIEHGSTDPMYASLPVIIMHTGTGWLGFVIDNPWPVFVNTGAEEGIFQPGAGPFVQEFFFGARNGAPDLWVIMGDSALDVVRKIQRLQGTTPRPPLWALGHHQCRWGYRDPADLHRIADGFEAHGIPNDGLWFDIDYMDGFRVFTTRPDTFGQPVDQIAKLRDRGYRVVPILDPGLRQDPDFEVYQRAREADILCKTGEGGEFVGYVWPGYTVFPDYSLAEGREFWAQEVETLTRLGFSGYWIDMNDPSTGSVPLDDMRFSRGQLPHEAWHNQYALGMAMATREGLLRARPGERPFVISRSGFLGQGKYSALWTGDNFSNEHHMKNALAVSLNLSVSGVPFNGPDVPGFAGDADAALMMAWYKLGFLFPFLRNHSAAWTKTQEPWTRGEVCTAVVREYIQLRYRLLPYLYQAFLDQEALGTPIIRPLWMVDEDPAFARCDDQFMTGDTILQAPFTDTSSPTRLVRLPRHRRGNRWLDVGTGRWESAGTALVKERHTVETPLFLASPGALPMVPGIPSKAGAPLDHIDLVLILEPGQSVEGTYAWDDGISIGTASGQCGQMTYAFAMDQEGRVSGTTSLSEGSGSLSWRPVILCPSKILPTLHVDGHEQTLATEDLRIAGTNLGAWGLARL